LPLQETVGSELRGFRDRAKLSVTGSVEAPVVGLLGEGALDEGRELLDCPIHHPRINEVLQALPRWIQQASLTPYQIRDRRGEFKGVILFRSPRSGEMYLRFVLRSKMLLPKLQAFLPVIQQEFPELVCVSVNLQPIPHALLEGPEEILLTARETLEHRLGPWALALAPQAFVQTHSVLAEKLYLTAAEWMRGLALKTAFDLYCGQGAFAFFGAETAQRWIGVEVNPSAVARAQQTAKTAGLPQVSFVCADARGVKELWAAEQPDLVLVNPPRAGLREGRELFKTFRPKHWLYSSCNAETLAEDLEWAQKHYELKRVQIFDLFPHTAHFETLVQLALK